MPVCVPSPPKKALPIRQVWVLLLLLMVVYVLLWVKHGVFQL
jgi:hypothetical protein